MADEERAPDPNDEFRLTTQYDASDPKAVAKRKSAEGRQRKADLDVVRMILKTPTGRSWFWRLMESCHTFTPSFAPGQPDVTAFREGERNVGNRLLQEAQRLPELYLIMAKEQNDAGY